MTKQIIRVICLTPLSVPFMPLHRPVITVESAHGIEIITAYYCCAHCAEQQGVTEAKDNINTP